MPDAQVVGWLDRQGAGTLFISTVSLAELLLGAALLPPGRRQHTLNTQVSNLINGYFADRILPFDLPAVQIYASLVAGARAKGLAIGTADGQIAAIAHTHRFSVATRDEAPFRACGLTVINPWAAPASMVRP